MSWQLVCCVTRQAVDYFLRLFFICLNDKGTYEEHSSIGGNADLDIKYPLFVFCCNFLSLSLSLFSFFSFFWKRLIIHATLIHLVTVRETKQCSAFLPDARWHCWMLSRGSLKILLKRWRIVANGLSWILKGSSFFVVTVVIFLLILLDSYITLHDALFHYFLRLFNSLRVFCWVCLKLLDIPLQYSKNLKDCSRDSLVSDPGSFCRCTNNFEIPFQSYLPPSFSPSLFVYLCCTNAKTIQTGQWLTIEVRECVVHRVIDGSYEG